MIKVYDVRTMKELQVFKGHKREATGTKFSLKKNFFFTLFLFIILFL